MINLCVPVLRRYDLLRELLQSVMRGTVKPTTVSLLDNGQNWNELRRASQGINVNVEVFTPHHPMGVAESWNWFLDNVPEKRVITNDDVIFAEHSLEEILKTGGLFVSPLAGTNAFSCFLITDECVRQTGKFDEDLSPGYAYFEDVDYAWRMEKQNIPITPVECGVQHVGSASLVENDEHHKKFMIAQANFEKKWGCLPADRERQRYGEKP